LFVTRVLPRCSAFDRGLFEFTALALGSNPFGGSLPLCVDLRWGRKSVAKEARLGWDHAPGTMV
jgi:hypothetical protein